jgi:hypothetical protein
MFKPAKSWLKALDGRWLRPGEAAFDREWLRQHFDLAPVQWQERLKTVYSKKLKAGQFEANTWLRETTASMSGLLLPISATDDDIVSKANTLADDCLRTAGAVTDGSILARHTAAERFCRARGIEPPAVRIPADFGLEAVVALVALLGLPALHAALEEEAAPALARMQDALWWRRQLRAQHARRIEQHAIALGYVHAHGEKYVSNVACRRRDQQKRRNAQALGAVEIVNQDGEVFTLADLAERSNANPRIRRAELMTRVAGFEAVARDLGHVAEFVTLTAPSRFHANGGTNAKFDGSSPREAQGWLCKTWQLIRAWANRKGIRVYGFRVAEPHQDGCPHWHLLLFMQPECVARFRAKFRRYAMRVEAAEQPEAPRTVAEQARMNREAGMRQGFAKLARLQVARAEHAHALALRRLENEDIDRKRHGCKFVAVEMSATKSAAGYIAKYISKNIDGYQVQLDLYGQDAIEGAARIEAWATAHGIRQFQQIGGAPVGVWRELRRLREADAEATETLEAARAAADAGAWSDYLRVQGGPTVKRADLALTLAKTREGEAWDGANQCPEPAHPGRYGDMPGPAVFGVRDQRKARAVVTRFIRWAVIRQPERKASAGQRLIGDTATAWRLPQGQGDTPVEWQQAVAAGESLGGFDVGVKGFDVPWTRVNNCTDPLASGAAGSTVGGDFADEIVIEPAGEWDGFGEEADFLCREAGLQRRV